MSETINATAATKEVVEAIEAGSQLSCDRLGLCGLAATNAASYGAALQILWRYAELTTLPFMGAVSVSRDTWKLRLFPRTAVTTHGLRYWSLYLLAFTRSLHRELCDEELMLTRVTLPFGSSEETSLFERFAERTAFNGLLLILEGRAESWNSPIDTADPITLELCLNQCILSLREKRRIPSLRETLWTSMARRPGRHISLQEFATDAGLSKRTIQRRITDQGTTFKALMHQIREAQITAMIADGIPIKEIAFRTCLDLSSVYRSLRKLRLQT